MSTQKYLDLTGLALYDGKIKNYINKLIQGGTHFVGVTTSVLTDGATTKPIKINNKDYNQVYGDIVIYGQIEFIWAAGTSDGNGVTTAQWVELGNSSAIVNAYNSHTHSASYTPAGSVSQPTFSGTKATIKPIFTGTAGKISASYNPAGSVSTPTFTGSAVTSGASSANVISVAKGEHTHSYTPAGTVASTFTGTKATISSSYTPAGSVSKPTFSGTAVNSDAAPSTNVVSVAKGTHTHSYTPAGTITSTFTGESVSGSTSYTPAGSVTQPTFTGTAVNTSATTSDEVSVAKGDHTHSVSVTGTVSKPTFTGSAVDSGSGLTTGNVITKAGTLPSHSAKYESGILTISFSAGTLPTLESSSHTHSVTAAGSVSQPTFKQASGSASATGSSYVTTVDPSGHTHSVTAAGTVSTPTFTGTAGTATGTFTPVGTIEDIEYTPAGTVSKPTFSGTATTITTGEPNKKVS